jgi:CheY-like chemotaxis protein
MDHEEALKRLRAAEERLQLLLSPGAIERESLREAIAAVTELARVALEELRIIRRERIEGLAAVIGTLRSHRASIEVEIPGAPGRGAATILVIENEAAVRKVATRILERAGFQVLAAADGVAGVALFRERAREIDAVVLDMTMPHMSGEEAFRQLRQVAPDVRVVLTSGYLAAEVTSRFAGEGLAGFLEKPFTPQQLVERVHAALDATKEVDSIRGF